MMAESILLTKPCKLQGANKAFVPGSLIISYAKLKWDASNGNSPSIDMPLESITGQQKAKGKPLLRVLTATRPIVLELSSEGDAEEVIRVLQKGATVQGSQEPKKGPSTSPAKTGTPQLSPEVKRQLLQNNKDLQRMYEQVVHTGLLSEAEFWQSRQSHVRHGVPATTQKLGLSSLMADAKFRPDSKENKVTFTLTGDMIQQILLEKPHIRRAYESNVPHNMDDQEFWSRYCNHVYAREVKRKKRAAAPPDVAAKEDQELFGEREEDMVQPRVKIRRVDPMVNLAMQRDDGFTEGFGIAHDLNREGYRIRNVGEAEEIMRDINRHAIFVVQQSGRPEDHLAIPPSSAAAGPNGCPPSSSLPLDLDLPEEQLAEVYRNNARTLEDLRRPPEQKHIELNIANAQRYFEGGGDGVSGEEAPQVSLMDLKGMVGRLRQIDPLRLPNPCVDPGLALRVLQELVRMPTEGDDLDNVGRITKSPAAVLSIYTQEDLRGKVLVVDELLRHYYACFPLSTGQRKQKCDKVKQALESKYDELIMMEKAALPKEKPYFRSLLKPVMAALDTAIDKYEAERNKPTVKQ